MVMARSSPRINFRDAPHQRRRGFQLIWAVGMLFFAIADACEAIGAISGWRQSRFRTA